MKKVILDMFSSKEGVSHKRVISVFAVLCIGIYAFGYRSIRAIEALEYIAIAYGLGTVAEKFVNNGKGQTNSENNNG
jgi:choline-glycine betaine transporter